jgi:hypothetical protein
LDKLLYYIIDKGPDPSEPPSICATMGSRYLDEDYKKEACAALHIDGSNDR